MLKIAMCLLIGPLMERSLRPLTAEESADLPRWMVNLDQAAYCLYGVLPAAALYIGLGLALASDFFDWLHGVPG